MKRTIAIPMLSAMFGCVLSFTSVNPAPSIPSYHMQVRIEPVSGSLEARVEIHSPQDSSFILNKDMVIRRIVADGRS